MSFSSANSTISEVLPDHYWAFFSFVPKDLPWADWLYFTLHGYPVPAALAVRATRFGFPLPDNISAFPDPNDPSHRAKMDVAISRARWLVVVVSPHSAHDPQIDEHIRMFKRAGGEERIIALVVEGEPPATSTLCVKSENRDWLPRWLQWRLGRDGRFVEADRSEPLIIDARPGYASLDDVMTTLISVLLDVLREELELLEALSKDHGEYAKASVFSVREKLIAAAMADLEETTPPIRPVARPVEPKRAPEAVRRPGLILALGGGLILATILAVVAWRNVDRDQRLKASAARAAESAVSQPEVTTAPVPEPEAPAEEVAAAAAEMPQVPDEEIPPPQAPVAVTIPPTAAETPVEAAAPLPPSEPMAEEPQVASVPEPNPLDRVRNLELAIDATTSRAEILLDQGQYESAAEAFEDAIKSAQSLATVPQAASSAYLRIAGLCRTLGALQMRIASDAEARFTFEQGLKALARVKGAKDVLRERSRLKVELDSMVKRLRASGND